MTAGNEAAEPSPTPPRSSELPELARVRSQTPRFSCLAAEPCIADFPRPSLWFKPARPALAGVLEPYGAPAHLGTNQLHRFGHVHPEPLGSGDANRDRAAARPRRDRLAPDLASSAARRAPLCHRLCERNLVPGSLVSACRPASRRRARDDRAGIVPSPSRASVTRSEKKASQESPP